MLLKPQPAVFALLSENINLPLASGNCIAVALSYLHVTLPICTWSAWQPYCLILGQWPSGQEEALLQRPDGERGGHVLQRGTGVRAADLGKGFSDGHFPGGGEDTGLHLNSRQRARNCDDFNLARGSSSVVLIQRLIMLVWHFQQGKSRFCVLAGNVLISFSVV